MTARKRARARKKAETPPVPRRVFAQASPRSIGGTSLFQAFGNVTSETVQNFYSQQDTINSAAAQLRDAGFEVLNISATTINIAGSPSAYKRAFNTTIYAEERPAIKELGEKTTAAFLDVPESRLPGLIDTDGTAFESVLEGVAIEEPRYFMAGESRYAPLKAYWHLRVPGDVSLACNADRAHRARTTGLGIRVAMVDSGWYRHPYFVGRGYRAAPVVLGPGAANPLRDESGHGTGESANVFAVAPDAQLLPVKINFTNSIGAFNAAVALNPDIITCSWGSSKRFGPLSAADQALAAAISIAVASGITVVFSAGNGHWGFPGQHPDVISAGGVFMNKNESLRASNYASGFMSNIYPNRRVPDLSGLVGMKPKAIYIMLPLESGDAIDTQLAGGTHPNGDETTTRDGWAAFSGTSAAAPQLAGAAALVKQACPRLTPRQIRRILMRTARDVTAGRCNTATGGNPAVPGPDTATGNGLVNAHRATLIAKLRCRTVIGPPVRPIAPGPILPAPPGPIPPQPILPAPPGPVPPRPILPSPPGPIVPASAAGVAAEHPSYLSEEDAATLEELIMKGEVEEE